MRAESIIIYSDYLDGITLYKVNDFNSRSFIKVTKNSLTSLLKNDKSLVNMIESHYGNFNNEQLQMILSKVKRIFSNYKLKINGIDFI
jgi:hypothetical protein